MFFRCPTCNKLGDSVAAIVQERQSRRTRPQKAAKVVLLGIGQELKDFEKRRVKIWDF